MKKVNLMYVNFIALAFFVMTVGINVYGYLNERMDVGNPLMAQGTGTGTGTGTGSCPTCVSGRMMKNVSCTKFVLSFSSGSGGSAFTCKIWNGTKKKCANEDNAQCDTALQEPCTSECNGEGGGSGS